MTAPQPPAQPCGAVAATWGYKKLSTGNGDESEIAQPRYPRRAHAPHVLPADTPYSERTAESRTMAAAPSAAAVPQFWDNLTVTGRVDCAA